MIPAHLIADLRHLNRTEKLRVITILVNDLAKDEGVLLDDDDVTASELEAEDALWDATLARHADQFAALKAQAYAEVKAGQTFPMFDERGEFVVE